MEKNIKLRGVLRSQFTKRKNGLETLMAAVKLKNPEVIADFRALTDIYADINNLDKIILVDLDEERFETELEDSHKYKTAWLLTQARFEKLPELKQQSCIMPADKDGRIRLPKLEIPKFDGELKSWLPFWSRFRKIDGSDGLDDEEKFIYLLQAVEEGTEARQLVDSYPISSENYIKCLEHLKARYAREDLLTQLYVRELLALVARPEEENLQSLFDKISAQLRSLETLGVTKKNAVFILPMVESALPADTLRAWQRVAGHNTGMEEELDKLLKFLQEEVENEQRFKMAKGMKAESANIPPEATASCLFSTPKNQHKEGDKCVWCDKDHNSLECYKLSKLTIDQRKEVLYKKKACTICLKKGHYYKNCKAALRCLICDKRHSTAVCYLQKLDKSKAPEEPNTTTTASASSPTVSQSVTLLQTAVVELQHNGQKAAVRVLFDSGSQRTYIKEDIVKKLQIPAAGEEKLTHALFGGVESRAKIHKTYDLKINSLDGTYSGDIVALSQDIICKNVPQCNQTPELKKMLRENHIILTDNSTHDGEVGLLIGADYIGMFLTTQMVQLQEKGLVAIRTKLGWTLQGTQVTKVRMNANYNVTTVLHCNCDNLTGYWALETLGIREPAEVKAKQEAEKEILTNFEETIAEKDGRYEVKLPFKSNYEDLQSNYGKAKVRLETMSKKLIKDEKFQQYDSILKNWEELGIIEKINNPQETGHFLPHRPVIKEQSLTSAMRPVFDASAKDKNGLCLNACLEKGTNMIDLIPNLLIGFRTGAIGVSADIQKAFLQIGLPAEDRDFLKFLWWEDNSFKKLVTYRHCRLVFGLTCSPFLLSATLRHHLNDRKTANAELLKRSWYVDNCLTSLDTEEEILSFIQESKEIMQAAEFNLRMWVTSPLKINEAGKDVISILGLNWDTQLDELFCSIANLPPVEDLGEVTKRELLSLTQRIFDPIGYTAPVMLTPKLIIQEAWHRKLQWDDPLPSELLVRFVDWYRHLTYLDNCRIPRKLTADKLKESRLSLHLFCDASKTGYGAGVVLRAEKDGEVSVQLITAKARVTPPKYISIPRLELLAALIGSRLLSQVKENTHLKNVSVHCWTDSSVVLCWIKRELILNNFVGNRIKEIRQLTLINDWHHIPGTENWADLASRGCTAKALLECRWWEGPTWLRLSPDQWPRSEVIVNEREVQAETKKTVCSAQVCSYESLLEGIQKYFSKYTKIIRTVAWVLRYLYNVQHANNKRKGEISYSEYEKAEKKVILLIQNANEEYLDKNGGNITKYKDNDGLTRLKTKLTLSPEFPETIHTPYVLPAKDPVVKLMVRQRHEQLMHVGVDQLIVDLRVRFWIVGIRRLAKSIIASCVICRRYRSKPVQAPTAPLPIERLISSAAFQTTGVDLAGPLILRSGEKCWVVLYTCAVYRAVHLELTRSLSTEAFLLTLRRFIARRGRASVIMSDQGTNFQGTRALLTSLDWEEVQRHSAVRRIHWKMNAPTAAWWGGFWERLIGVMKTLLRRIIGKASLTYDELQTILCECEAVMNGRPLTYINDDNGECVEPLTPAHFLQPESQTITEVGDLDIIDSSSLNNRLRFIQKLREQFLERFKTEYLTLLVQKGKETKSNLKVGDVVLIETAEKKIRWPLGLVQRLIAGRDGIERTAEVRTYMGIKIRPVQRLYNLEISSNVPVPATSLIPCKPTALPPSRNQTGEEQSPSVNSDKIQIAKPTIQTSRTGRSLKIPSRLEIYQRY